MLDDRASERLAATRFRDVRWFDELGSTNDWLLQLARDGAAEGVVVVADHQTAGRGRLGRSWDAPPGSALLMSVLLRPGLPIERAQLLTAAVGLAAAEACGSVAGFTPDLKWPNDLVVDLSPRGPAGKLAGILAESDVRGGVLQSVVVGLGMNVNWDDPPASLKGVAVAANQIADCEVDRVELLVALLMGLERRYQHLDDVVGEYRRACATLGRQVRVTLATEEFEGLAVELSDEGALGVELADGRRRWVAAGDVTHVRAA
jgi:BirA family biotin operon repressor/biotin-[acetyl-CoA-carboxylase] ligase